MPTPLESIESASLKALLAYLNSETGFTWRTTNSPPAVGEILGTVSFFTQNSPLTLAGEIGEQRLYLALDAYGPQSIEFQCLILDWVAAIQDLMTTAGGRGIPGTYRGQAVQLLKGAKPSGSPFRIVEAQVEPSNMSGSETLALYKARLIYDTPILRERFSPFTT